MIFSTPWGWYKCIQTCRSDDINTVKIKKYILCIVGWNKNYTQDARYVHKNKKIKYKIFILVRSVIFMNRLALNTHRAHKNNLDFKLHLKPRDYQILRKCKLFVTLAGHTQQALPVLNNTWSLEDTWPYKVKRSE